MVRWVQVFAGGSGYMPTAAAAASLQNVNLFAWKKNCHQLAKFSALDNYSQMDFYLLRNLRHFPTLPLALGSKVKGKPPETIQKP